TVTEIYDYLRLLFARVGHPHCPECGREIASQTVQQIVDTIQGIAEGSQIMILAPLIRDRKGEYQAGFDDLRQAGYVRVRVDGHISELSEPLQLDKNKKHSIEAVVDRLVIGQSGSQGRLADSVETALKLGAGVVLVSVVDGEELLFSEHFSCVYCGISLGEIAPRTFSFNSPHGACPACTGLGVKLEIDPELVIPNKELSIAQGAIHPGWWFAWHADELAGLARRYDFSLDAPVGDLSESSLKLILYGEEGKLVKHRNRYGRVREHFTGYEGVIPYLERLSQDTPSERTRAEIGRYMMSTPCPVCQGKRLKPESLAVSIDGKNIAEVSALSVDEALAWVATLGDDGKEAILTERERMIAHQVLKEIQARLGFLQDVGLGYLTLDRPSATLSGGEAQRIRLATQIGSGLMGVLYICDEPTVGLHPADGSRLIETLKRLRDLGNTVLIVEHDEAMMRAADYIIDMGPGAGEHGGQVVATGTMVDIMQTKGSITGQYLSGVKQIPLPPQRRPGSGKEIVI
ncbi:MAG: excinuclease ABC subunit UvrA, partial [Dehalococcoidales bacterium]|nr:excinuclease ABC subunit UvrA [Dehalococcoidales bacterium]